METRYGFPVVSSSNVFNVLSGLGVKPWPRVSPPILLDEYLKRDLTEEERGDLRFAPKTEVIQLLQPNGKTFTGFRAVGKSWATVFVLIESDLGPLVPIVGEFKHGEEVVSLVPPSGVPNKTENQIEHVLERMSQTGKREFEEETGLKLNAIFPLSGPQGIPVSTRQLNNQRCYPFYGYIKPPYNPGPSKLDKSEFLKMVLVPLDQWIVLIKEGKVLEDCAISTTFLALMQLGHLAY